LTEIWYELTGNPAYRHVLLNHLPITGLALAAVALAWGLFEDRWSSIGFGLVLCLVTSGSAVLVMQSGDAAYPYLFERLVGARRPAWRRRAAIAVLVTTTASLVAGSVIAESGGKVRHDEFRTSNPPVHDTQGRDR
jgi:hypothetical protein